jgi:hypothetical protein
MPSEKLSSELPNIEELYTSVGCNNLSNPAAGAIFPDGNKNLCIEDCQNQMNLEIKAKLVN